MSENIDTSTAPKALLKAQRLANLLDTSVKLPLINFRIGLDGLLGLIPGVGDVAMLLVSLRIVMLGRQMGLPKGQIKAMLRNCLLDFGLGFIPLAGDLLDFFFKANQANVRIMEKYWVSTNKAAIDKSTQQKLREWESSL